VPEVSFPAAAIGPPLFQQENVMLTLFNRFFGLLVVFALLVLAPVHAQSPNAGAEAAAKELIDTMKLPDQFKAMLPMIFRQIKSSLVQNRPEVDRDYDALAPKLLDTMNGRIEELASAIALIYASNFSEAELRDLTAFYRTPTGQKLLQKLPFVTQQTMIAGQKFGQSAAADLQKQMREELRRKGHDL
jgi:hypothetical protein